jgi:hypothetical protein
MAGGMFFIVIQLMFLIDFAYTFNESLINKYEMSYERKWIVILAGSAAVMYVGSLVFIIVQYVNYAGSGCELNQFFISFNLILLIGVSVLCVIPKIQEYNPTSGLTQAVSAE